MRDAGRRSLLPLSCKALVFAAFLQAGQFKGDPRLNWLSVDLTMLLALAVAGLTAWTLLRDGFRFPPQVGWMLLLFSLFTVPVLWTDLHPYGGEKVSRFFTLTLLASVAPLVLFKTKGDLARLWSALALFGLISAYDATRLLANGTDLAGRLSSFGANPIAFGRSVGVVLIWAGVSGVEGRLAALPALGLVGLSSVLLIASGSRGPLLTSVACLVLAGFLFYRSYSKLLVRCGVAAVALALAVQFGMGRAPEQAAGRIASLAGGELGTSEWARLDAYRQSLATIVSHPGGLGWGAFASHMDPSGNGGHDRQYPHNLFLEVLLEGGWVSGLYFMALLGAVLLRLLRLPPALETRALFLLFLFALANAQVSGDLNDNRHLFALAALGLRTRWDQASGDGKSGPTDLRARLPGHPHLP
jgi:O-antigen ligase